MAKPFMMMKPTAPASGGTVCQPRLRGLPGHFPTNAGYAAARPAQALPMPFIPATPVAVAPFDPAVWMQIMSGMAPISGTPSRTHNGQVNY